MGAWSWGFRVVCERWVGACILLAPPASHCERTPWLRTTLRGRCLQPSESELEKCFLQGRKEDVENLQKAEQSGKENIYVVQT